MDKHQVAIVIPAFNEEDTIYNEVQSVKEDGVVIVVNDASVDDTEKKARKAGAIVINHKSNKGYDGALNSGFLKANELGCEIIITFDADGQHDSSMIKKFIILINSGYDVVIGIRGRFQRLSEHIFSWVSILKWGIRDPLCGMKAYSAKVYKELGHFSSYDSIGTELCIFSHNLGFKIIQIPVEVHDRSDDSRMGGRVSANIKILSALFNTRNIKKI
ncbi:MAG: hypothetical protein CMD03_05490 [Flavobacteriales bacterium]|nr:hypothetical protein [Flavobacteriales bacterium]